MLRTSPQARVFKGKRIASSLAMAMALAGAGLAGTAAYAPAAAAQEYSSAFRQAYGAVQAITTSGATDFSAARPLLPALLQVTVNPDEKSATGNLLLQIGQNLRDTSMQRQALEMILSSGQVAEAAQGQYYYYIGNFAFQQQDMEAGRAALRRAVALGFTPAEAASDPQLDPRTQILQSYFLGEDFNGLISYADELLAASGGTGQGMAETWLTYGLQGAIETENLDAAVRFSQPLVTRFPTDRNWRNALRVVGSLGNYDVGQELADLMRLMAMTNTLTDRRDYIRYLASIDTRLMANEALGVLAKGLQSGAFTATDQAYTVELETATDRAPAERRGAAALATEARSAPTGREAYEAGEAYFSIADYAQAETFYALALEKGSQDDDRDRMRLAISQVHQGKLAEADANMAQIGGTRAPIAAMWRAYIANQQAS